MYFLDRKKTHQHIFWISINFCVWTITQMGIMQHLNSSQKRFTHKHPTHSHICGNKGKVQSWNGVGHSPLFLILIVNYFNKLYNFPFVVGGYKEFSSMYPQMCRRQSKLTTCSTLNVEHDNAHRQVKHLPGNNHPEVIKYIDLKPSSWNVAISSSF